MKAKKLAALLVGIVLPLSMACQRDRVDTGPSIPPLAPSQSPDGRQKSDTPDDSPPSPPDLKSQDAIEAAVPIEARVPNTMFREDECDTRAEAPDAFTWAQAADAIVLGKVRALRLAVDKVIGPDGKGGWKWHKDCKVANPALVIDLVVENAYTGEVPKEVSVRVGWVQLQYFRPQPLANGENGLIWTGIRSKSAGPLKPGSRVVTGLHKVDDVWSLMGDTILGVDAEDRIHVPRRPGDCLTTTPDELASKTIAEAAEIFARYAPTEAGEERRKLHQLLWGKGQTPAFYSAGYCTHEVPELAVEPEGLPSLKTEEKGKASPRPNRQRKRD